MRKLDINLKNSNYEIIIENGLINNLCNYISKVYHNEKIYILTDENVSKYYLEKVLSSLEGKYTVDYLIIAPGEESKSILCYQDVCEKLIDKGIKRNHIACL